MSYFRFCFSETGCHVVRLATKSLYSKDQPCTPDPPAFTSQVLGLQRCSTTPSVFFSLVSLQGSLCLIQSHAIKNILNHQGSGSAYL